VDMVGYSMCIQVVDIVGYSMFAKP